jgi:5,5'-dehydrodivanillate O-demethylase
MPFGANNVMRMEGIDDTHVSCYGYPTVNRFTSPPFKKGGELIRSMIFRVPVDDASTLLYFIRFAPDGEPGIKTSRRETKYGEYTQLATDWWGIDVNDQDRMAVEQQGVIADRPNEHLGVSDGGIIAMRQMMRESLAAVAAGKDPLCIIRDPAGQKVDFPVQATMTEQTQDDVGYARGYGEAAETYAEAGE